MRKYGRSGRGPLETHEVMLLAQQEVSDKRLLLESLKRQQIAAIAAPAPPIQVPPAAAEEIHNLKDENSLLILNLDKLSALQK